MAGASIKLDYKIKDQDVIRAFKRLEKAGTNAETLFADIGEHLIISHDERFADQESPEGEPWKPLNETYRLRKKKNQDKVLILDSYLRDLLAYNASGGGLEFGTPSIYGATHQFGAEDRGIPARPFLGISGSDETEINHISLDYLDDALFG